MTGHLQIQAYASEPFSSHFLDALLRELIRLRHPGRDTQDEAQKKGEHQGDRPILHQLPAAQEVQSDITIHNHITCQLKMDRARLMLSKQYAQVLFSCTSKTKEGDPSQQGADDPCRGQSSYLWMARLLSARSRSKAATSRWRARSSRDSFFPGLSLLALSIERASGLFGAGDGGVSFSGEATAFAAFDCSAFCFFPSCNPISAVRHGGLYCHAALPCVLIH